jgi:hypothetical protein
MQLISRDVLCASNPAAKVLRSILVQSLTPRYLSNILFDPAQGPAVRSVLSLVLVLASHSELCAALIPLHSVLIKFLGSQPVAVESIFFQQAAKGLLLISGYINADNLTSAVSTLQDANMLIKKISAEPLNSASNFRVACEAVCEIVRRTCTVSEEQAAEESSFDEQLMHNTIAAMKGLIILFGVEDDETSRSTSGALCASAKLLARLSIRAAPSLSASCTATALDIVRSVGSSEKRHLSSLQLGILREFAAASLEGPPQGRATGPSGSSNPDGVPRSGSTRLLTLLQLCSCLTGWLGSEWLASTKRWDSEKSEGSSSSATFIRTLIGCVATEAKVRLDDIEYWLVLADVPSAANSDSKPFVAPVARMACEPNDTTAALASFDQRLAALPRARRLAAAASSFDDHAAALDACWSLLEACVHVLAASVEDDGDATGSDFLNGCSPDDLLALRGILQDTASFALMAVSALWNSDLRATLVAASPMHPVPTATLSGLMASSSPEDAPDAMILRSRAATPVVTRAALYALAYLQVGDVD